MKGLSWLTGEMLLCLLVAALLGFLLGWLLRGWRCSRRFSEYEERIVGLEAESERYRNDVDSLQLRYRDEIEEKDRSINEYTSKLSLLESAAVERDAEVSRLNADYTSRISALEQEIDGLNYLREDIKVKDTTIERLQSDVRKAASGAAATSTGASSADASGVDASGETHRGRGGSWFDMFKNPEDGQTIAEQADDADDAWYKSASAKIAAGAASVGAAVGAAAGNDDKNGEHEGSGWRAKINEAKQSLAAKAREVSHSDAKSNAQDDTSAARGSDTQGDSKTHGSTKGDTAGAKAKASTSTSTAKADTAKKTGTKPKAAVAKSASGKKADAATNTKATKPKAKSAAKGAGAAASAAAGAAAAAGVAAGAATVAKGASATKRTTTQQKSLSKEDAERIQQIRESRGVKIEKKIFTKAVKSDDDLTVIYGIGPVMEGILHDLGIFSFKQLATLDSAQLATLRDSIGTFRNRVDRDNWMKGAADAHKEKYGQAI